MQVADMVTLITNVGFPVTLSFILIKYVLQTMGEKLDKMDATIHLLSQQVKSIESRTEATKTADQADAKTK
ncbi:hypothetical protein [Paenibacillus lentus]|uniref:YvrJ family protein n=1 Tax=Paenibacillus lentus TaxID=1338368 RepID=A0A3Q8S6P9_9BACL|nr:hypothetical protein [Paenibacillus lentus]AZK48480.1 hypothetical protein EIM92_21785 [Paenibacillus lentus]